MLPGSLTDAETDAIAEEQRFLDRAVARRDRLTEHLRDELEAAVADELGVARQRMLRRQHEELVRARDGLVFGRLDALDGTVRHVGRVGLRDEDETADPLLLDWRAPAARPFYTATAIDPQGQARRRHVRTAGAVVTGVNDEPLDGAGDTGLVGEGALLAALDERRTGRMSTAIATLQREQDDIVRAEATGPLIVQGGPGTGKTVVALHRVAYLLVTHRQMAEQAVLVLGPSARFLEYIGQVLPALGETAVVSATCDTLVPGVVVGREEDRAVSEIKGRALWQAVFDRYVGAMVPRARHLRLRWAGEDYVIGGAVVTQIVASATQGRSYHRARAVFAEQLHLVLAEAVAEQREAMLAAMEEGFEDILARVDRGLPGGHVGASASDVDGLLSEEEIEELRERIAEDAAIARFVEFWWPTREPAAALRELLSDPAALRRFAPELSPEEIAQVVADRAPVAADEAQVVADQALVVADKGPAPRAAAGTSTEAAGQAADADDPRGTGEPRPWAAGDIPLLDALADLLGESGPETPPPGGSVAEHARRQRGWVYGHVVVDEAQELSEMQWQMVLRRCPTRSITAVGDIDQAEASHRHTSWAQAVQATLGERWTAAELTICYRTPREVMALTGPVLERAGSHNTPPRAVRSAGIEPWELTVTPQTLLENAEQSVAALRQRWAGGTVGVVAPVSRVGALRVALPDVPVLTATQAKGLEWDATLVVDPQGIAAEPRGWNGLYVALTRCTQELGQLALAP
ncbi:helicase [Actinoplanes awajinensis subsp. mycoplanecinus]|uniref:Helicase n=1 Tax=Actinoplanes awajinensis subsp. mycoplanecinus TaxID=135947 RepID=A0A124G7P1_9ACTN|nr:helicase [Actinoplanes awajinensis subsp. mycoplanecinus]